MSKQKLSKRIDHFASIASIVSPLCAKYNVNSIKPFIEGAQVYNENFRSSVEFINTLRLHREFMVGSIAICSRLFDNYEPAKQSYIYVWSKHLFDLLNAAKTIIDESYNLAYTVGRSDATTKTIIDKETNPLVKIHRKVILEDSDYDTYKKNMFNWKCTTQSIYVEERYMKHIVELCNSRKSKFNPKEAKLNTCTLRRTITIPDNDYSSTPQLCVLNAELYTHKAKIELHEKNNKLTTSDIDNYVLVYTRYQRELISFVFLNFSKLYNEQCVQCIKIFLEQQHSIMYNLLERRKKLVAEAAERTNENKRLDDIAWTNIDKTTSAYINSEEETCSAGNSKFCTNQTKVVGSLE